jgi:hypothetical protein
MKPFVIILFFSLFVGLFVKAQNQTQFNVTMFLNGQTVSGDIIEEETGYSLRHNGTSNQAGGRRIFAFVKFNSLLEVIENTVIDSSINNIDYRGSIYKGFHKLGNGKYLGTGVKINFTNQRNNIKFTIKN